MPARGLLCPARGSREGKHRSTRRLHIRTLMTAEDHPPEAPRSAADMARVDWRHTVRTGARPRRPPPGNMSAHDDTARLDEMEQRQGQSLRAPGVAARAVRRRAGI